MCGEFRSLNATPERTPNHSARRMIVEVEHTPTVVAVSMQP